MNPRFPVYVISKGRWNRRQTVRTLEYMNVPYKIVVEPSEYEKYVKHINAKNILELPDNFSEKGKGSIPARNWVWEHSIKNGDSWHWILDDNIESVERFNNNLKVKCKTGSPFYAIEEFVLRYTNVVQAGMHYSIFCPYNEGRPPINFNTRIYSCILIKNDLPYRWRGKYNEDTDLSLRILKDGLCTVLFNAFLIGKRATQTQGGGNTDTVYAEDNNRKEFSESLRQKHPRIVKVIKRCGRWHHYVDYSIFDQKPILKEGVKLRNSNNEYEMKLLTLTR